MNYLTLPLVLAFFAFLAGLLPGLRFGGPPLLFAAGAVLTLVAGALSGRAPATSHPSRASVALLLTFALVGAALGAGGHHGALGDCRARIPDGMALTVRGVLAANARGVGNDFDVRNPLVPVAIEEARTVRGIVPGCSGEVRVRIPRNAPTMRAGSELTLQGGWREFDAPVIRSAWPADPAFAGFLEVREIASRSPPRFASHPLLTLRGRTEAHLHRIFPRHGALADALVLGRREGLDRTISDRFAQSGLVHLLAISGTHVALIAGVLLLLGGVLRVPRVPLTWSTLVLVAAYLAVIGAPASAVRSGIMVGLGLVAVLLQRPSAALPVVAASAFVILGFTPAAVLDPGFQLSYAGVLGILLLRGAMLRRIPGSWREHPAGRWTVESLVVSCAAFVATAPITAYHFGQVAPVSILANLPAIPLSGLA
ncbi:MAG TPA: ComEC/Rec2 family competence protein, partial [Longimicrobiaceae bacterium]|nr:ComEC/Rec2 family competence protein [Longimicrobiaceae bacterium]